MGFLIFHSFHCRGLYRRLLSHVHGDDDDASGCHFHAVQAFVVRFGRRLVFGRSVIGKQF